MSAIRIFADTNVLFDIFARREPFFASAEKLQIMQEFGDAEIWVSSESFTDIFYVMSKAFPSHDIQRAFDRSLDFLHVCSVGESELREALRANWDDLKDAVIYTCCRNVDADFLLTRDAKGFVQSQTPALSPEEFFAWLEREHDLVYSGLQ